MHDQDSLYAFNDWFLNEALNGIETNESCDCVPVRIIVYFLDEPIGDSLEDEE